jgi:hypothetical protein
MMARASFRKTSDVLGKSLQAMVDRGRSLSTYFNRALFPQYQQAQIERWETQGSSQGEEWAPLTKPYATRKKKLFAAFPGAGNVLMVATGRLASGAQGKDAANYVKLITDSMIRVSVNLSTLPYAKYPGVMRPFMIFSQDQEYQWAYDATQYVMGGR